MRGKGPLDCVPVVPRADNQRLGEPGRHAGSGERETGAGIKKGVWGRRLLSTGRIGLIEHKAGAEALMLGLRTAEGMTPPAGFEGELGRLASAGLIERTHGRIAPTRRGMDMHNQIALAVL